MPTRLEVLLHRRKSAAAGCVSAASRMPVRSEHRAVMVIRAVQNRVPFLPSRRLSLNPLRSVNENSTEIIDVREGRARHQKVTQGTEKGGRIVVGEKGGRIEAKGPGAFGRRGVDKSPCRIVRAAAAAVGSIGIAGEP